MKLESRNDGKLAFSFLRVPPAASLSLHFPRRIVYFSNFAIVLLAPTVYPGASKLLFLFLLAPRFRSNSAEERANIASVTARTPPIS